MTNHNPGRQGDPMKVADLQADIAVNRSRFTSLDLVEA
jgi:hypothetical protein